MLRDLRLFPDELECLALGLVGRDGCNVGRQHPILAEECLVPPVTEGEDAPIIERLEKQVSDRIGPFGTDEGVKTEGSRADRPIEFVRLHLARGPRTPGDHVLDQP